MPYYVRTLNDDDEQIWEIDEDVAIRLFVSNPKEGPGCYFERGSHQTIWAAISAGTGWFEGNAVEASPFCELELPPGSFFPRMARPQFRLMPRFFISPSAKLERDACASYAAQVENLVGRLKGICRTIHPSEENFGSFGQEIRDLIILAATEVETHFRAILRAHDALPSRPGIGDDFKLFEIMQLGEYAIAFPTYPWLEPMKPFAGWRSDRPGSSLAWYDAYNGLKHDRELQLKDAALRNAFSAVSAVAVLIYAQFGSGGNSAFGDANEFFDVQRHPEWGPGQHYLYAGAKDPTLPVRHPLLIKDSFDRRGGG